MVSFSNEKKKKTAFPVAVQVPGDEGTKMSSTEVLLAWQGACSSRLPVPAATTAAVCDKMQHDWFQLNAAGPAVDMTCRSVAFLYSIFQRGSRG